MSLANLNLGALEKQYGLPAGLLTAVAKTESGGNPNAVSPAGAQGLFQFMPETAKAYGVNPFDPQSSAIGAARMYSDLSKQFGGDVPSMLAAYNWGSGNLSKKGLENAPKETRDYIAKIVPLLNGQNLGKGTQYADSGQIMSDGMVEVTDPSILAQLNDATEVTDPEILKQLESSDMGKKPEKSATQDFLDTISAIPNQLAQGGTFGLADEAQAALAASYLTATGKGTYDENYAKALEIARGELAKERQDAPITSILANIAGGVGSGALAARGISKGLAAIAPETSSAIGGAIAANPIKSTAGLGGIQGSLYGFGTGEGGAGERGQSALLGGVLGGATGGLASYAGGAIANKIANDMTKGGAVTKIAQRFGRSVPKPATVTDEPIAGISEQPISTVLTPKEITTETGKVLNLPKGVANRDVNTLRVQEEARQGILGDAAQVAQRKIDDAIIEDTKKATQSLIGKETTDNPDDILLRGIESFRKQYATDKAKAGELMNIRNQKIADAKIYKEYTHNTLNKGIDDVLKSPDNAIFTQTTAAKPILEYKAILDGITKPKDTKFTSPLSFDRLQGWSASVSKFARDAKQAGRDQEAAVANQMVGKYNDWLDNITKEAFKSGDDDLVKSIFDANRNYVSFKKTFGTNRAAGESKIIEDVLKKDALTPDQLVNMVFGKNALGKDTTNQNMGRMLKAVSDDVRPQMINDFRSGIVMRAYKSALNPDGSIKMGTFANKLRDVYESPAYKAHLSDPVYDGAIKGLAQDITSYVRATSDPLVRSTSGTGGAVSRLLTKILDNPLMSRGTVGLSTQLNEIAQKATKVKSRAQIREIEKEFFGELEKALSKPVNYIKLGGVAGGAATGEPLRITITGDDVRRAKNEQ